MIPRLATTCLLLGLPQLLLAQKLTQLTVDHDRAAVEQQVTVQVQLEDGTGRTYCGLRINFGDGEVKDIRIDQLTVTSTKAYKTPGTYTVSVAGLTLLHGLHTAMACDGAIPARQLIVFDAKAEEEKERQALALKTREDALAAREQAASDQQAAAREALKAAQATAALAARLAASKPATAVKPAAPAASKPKDRPFQ